MLGENYASAMISLHNWTIFLVNYFSYFHNAIGQVLKLNFYLDRVREEGAIIIMMIIIM